MSVAIRCRYCGARETISEVTLKSLTHGDGVTRSCTTCRSGTPWDVVVGEATSFTGARALSEEVDQERAIRRVLIVDDDTEMLEVLTRALSRETLEVEAVTSGREALNRLIREDFDLILSDVRMPEFDGKQLYKFVEEHVPDHKDRVIFLTGDVGTESTMEFIRGVGAPCLEKPVDLTQLLKLVREKLGSRAASGMEPGTAASAS